MPSRMADNAVVNCSVTALSCFNKCSTNLSAVFRPMLGKVAKASTAFSMSLEEKIILLWNGLIGELVMHNHSSTVKSQRSKVPNIGQKQSVWRYAEAFAQRLLVFKGFLNFFYLQLAHAGMNAGAHDEAYHTAQETVGAD